MSKGEFNGLKRVNEPWHLFITQLFSILYSCTKLGCIGFKAVYSTLCLIWGKIKTVKFHHIIQKRQKL
ncbi:hypothetical protein [Methanococcus maripaludis]|uniref:hypothetical protein n=1 Tax=Methanococcus maripaludis TaxID=39152 RepID=UPI000650037E|nr:hypothetical protein [Methanococcus maripaludis]